MLNDQIFFFFYSLAHQSKVLDNIIIFLAVYFVYVVVVLALFFLLRRFNWKEIILVSLSGGLAWGLAKIVKILIHTPRPFNVFSQVQSLFTETGYAFPSGHTAFASALAFAIFFLNKKVGYIFIVSAVLIGIARIAAGVHFSIDILGGFLIGFIISYIFNYFFRKLKINK